MKRDHRLRIFDAQTVSFALKTPWSDGTIHVLLSPEELIEEVGDAGAAATMPARPGAGRLRNRTWPPLGRLCSLFRRGVAGRTACSALAKAAVRAITSAPQCPAANLPAGAAGDGLGDFRIKTGT